MYMEIHKLSSYTHFTTSSLRHHRCVPPFLPKAQMGSDHVVGVAANLIQLPS